MPKTKIKIDSSMLEHVKCNLCGSNEHYYFGKKDGFRIVKCRACGLIYVNPRLNKKGMAALYAEDYFSNRAPGMKERLEQYKLDIKDMERFAKRGKILDVGAGGGFFLNSLGSSWEKHGTEISKAASSHAREKLKLDVRTGDLTDKKVKLEKASFDVVHSRATIEHMPDPMANLRKMNDMLKDGGLLVLSNIPNIGGISGKLYKERFNLVKGDEHIYNFTPKTLSMMLKKAGFRVIAVRYPYFGSPYASPIRDFFRFFWNYIAGKESPPFYGNIMTLYAIKQKI